MNGEHWLPVVGHEKDYWVSSWGAVWSRYKGGLLKPGRSSNGYLTVCLWSGPTRKSHCVQYLVTAAFLGTKPDGLLVLHRDDCRTHNALQNLYYGTSSDNSHDITRNGNRAIPSATIRAMRAARAQGRTQQSIATEFGVGRRQVGYILTGEQYQNA